MSSPHRWSQHVPADAPRDAHNPGYWTAGPSGYESPRGAFGRSSLAYVYGTSETTTWTTRRGKTVDYVFRSRTTRRRNWSSVEPEMETRGSLRMEEPEAPRIHDHKNIRDSYRIVRGPSYRDSRSPEYSRPRSSDRKYWQESYNSKPSRSQGHRPDSYSSGEESDHKSSKHRCDKSSSQTNFESGHRSSRSHYSDDGSRKSEYELDANIRSSHRNRDYGRSNKHESGRTSNQNHYNSDNGRSRRSNKYKTEPRYEKARPRISSTIEGEEEELPNYYATLGISSYASSDEIKKAARLKRVEVHPDRCIKPDMSEMEKAKAYKVAAAVGQAADVLTDRGLKFQYDKNVACQWTL